jgi:hypothetical protein
MRKDRIQGLFLRHEDDAVGLRPKEGVITFKLEHPDGTVEQFVRCNLIVKTASILVARLVKNNLEPGLKGITYLAVGQGDPAWDPMNPPAATADQETLENEIARKAFSAVDFIDDDGNVSGSPTSIVDFTTVFGPGEAAAPWVEQGLVGGVVTSAPYSGTLVNYATFPVINKPAASTMTVVWRLTF